MNRSKKIGRSVSHPSILLLGRTGVGKSSTINHLFRPRSINGETNFEIAKTSHSLSETIFTAEYVFSIDNATNADKDINLGVVDSPGFHSSRGLEQDACNYIQATQ